MFPECNVIPTDDKRRKGSKCLLALGSILLGVLGWEPAHDDVAWDEIGENETSLGVCRAVALVIGGLQGDRGRDRRGC
jgi:hypothetical protein